MLIMCCGGGGGGGGGGAVAKRDFGSIFYSMRPEIRFRFRSIRPLFSDPVPVISIFVTCKLSVKV